VNRNPQSHAYYPCSTRMIWLQNGPFFKLFSRNRDYFKPLLRKIFHALCDNEYACDCSNQAVMALKTLLFPAPKWTGRDSDPRPPPLSQPFVLFSPFSFPQKKVRQKRYLKGWSTIKRAFTTKRKQNCHRKNQGIGLQATQVKGSLDPGYRASNMMKGVTILVLSIDYVLNLTSQIS